MQGVGFRPFIYRLAIEHDLNGWVQNNASGVIIEVEGSSTNISRFAELLQKNSPPNAVITSFASEQLALKNDSSFTIVDSDTDAEISASILPDLATCPDCLVEMNNPANFRYRYAFINCTNCGPRFTIVIGLPYDRPQTTMAEFKMCNCCSGEYKDPLDRRFHAQPIACANCGPHLELWDKAGNVIASHDDALTQASEAVKAGKVLALKGLGGFHLIADAGNDTAVNTLRQRKHRPRKPFALMVANLKQAKEYCVMSGAEEKTLQSPQAPIVLLGKKQSSKISQYVAPENPCYGVMLPSTPLHHLLMQEVERPIIATSGNRANEPICTDEHDALERLSGIADLFLVHNRPIKNCAEDSIVRFMAGQEMVLRRARGYAPLPLMLKQQTSRTILAVGGHLKNTVALAVADKLILSPHIGDLDSPQALTAHENAINTLCQLYGVEADMVACDKHPNYASTRMAETHVAKKYGGNITPVQHHYAHALACLLDNEITPPALAVVWDGAGYGDDGTIWGGEFLRINEKGYERISHFRPFPLAGGDAAAKNPSRAAFGLLYEAGLLKNTGLETSEEKLLKQALDKNINCPMTSSVGRLFDAIAYITGVATENSFEGEAAMALEFAAMTSGSTESYDFDIQDGIINWQKMLSQIFADQDVADQENKVSAADIARKFHNTLTDIIVAAAIGQTEKQVLLTGGCFQNKLLLERTVEKLEAAGFDVFWHNRIPPNDGGLASGQVMAQIMAQL